MPHLVGLFLPTISSIAHICVIHCDNYVEYGGTGGFGGFRLNQLIIILSIDAQVNIQTVLGPLSH